VNDDNPSLSAAQRAEAHAAAAKIVSSAAAAEPAISADVKRIAETNGGRLERFKYRLKAFGSLYRKIQGIMHFDQTDAKEAAVQIRDAVRYTVVLDDEGYWAKGTSIREALEQAGYTGSSILTGQSA
jgi:hypothetical protein